MSWRTTPDDLVPVLISSFWEIKTAQIIRSQMMWRTSLLGQSRSIEKNPKVSAKTVVVPELCAPNNCRDTHFFCPGHHWAKKFVPVKWDKTVLSHRFLSPGQSFKFESSPPIVGISASSGTILWYYVSVICQPFSVRNRKKSSVLFLWETSFLVFNFLLQERKVLFQIWDIVFKPFKNPANGSCLSSTTWSIATINAYSHVIITLTIATPR